MKPQSNTKYALHAKVMKALAHPTRVLIVSQLAKKELCVCEMRDIAGVDISTVSKHLSILKNAGIVTDRREGTSIYYRLAMKCVLTFFSCIQEALKSKFSEEVTIIEC